MARPIVLCFALLACSRSPAEPAPSGAGATSSSQSLTDADHAPNTKPASGAPPSTGHQATGLLWNDPPNFVRVAPKSPARAAEYKIARVSADPEDAECVVMTFGPRQGGTVDDNVKRWLDQFNPVVPTPRRATLEVNGMHATFVEVTGTFAGNMMPNGQGQVMPASKPGWRMLGAIVESPSGLWFFKLTGPDLTVRTAAQGFEDMVRSARPS